MIDERLYRETFSRLQASGEAKEEVLMQMNERKKKRPWRALRSAAIAAILIVALAVSVNAASGGVLLGEMLTIVWSDGLHQVAVDEAGNEWNLYSIGAGTEIRDGRVILSALGEETDITDALEQTGEFTKDYDVEGFTATVKVTGTPEEHEIWLTTPEVTIGPGPGPDTNVGVHEITDAEDGEIGLTDMERFDTTFVYDGSDGILPLN